MAEIKKGNNKFFVGEDEANPLAEMDFKVTEEGQFDVDHTFVSDELRGQGIAQDLLKRMIELARDEGRKIIPTCPFVKKQIENNKEYQDVLYKN